MTPVQLAHARLLAHAAEARARVAKVEREAFAGFVASNGGVDPFDGLPTDPLRLTGVGEFVHPVDGVVR